MSNDINLLQPTRRKRSPIFERRVRLLRILSVGFLFIVGVVSSALFLVSNFSPLPALKEQESEMIAEFSRDPLRKKTDAFFLSKVRIGDITKLLEVRSKVLNDFNFYTALNNDNVKISKIEIGLGGALVVLESGNLLEIENAVSELKKRGERVANIESISISSVDFQAAEGIYSVSVEVKNKAV